MSLLSKESNTLMADKFVHASILDGISLGGAKLKRYPHQDLTALPRIQQKYPEAKYCITEGVFSMDGDISPLQDIVQSLNGTAQLVVDDAHGFGVLGQQGKGTVNHARLTHQEVPLMIIPCGKAMGVMGALVCASRPFIELLMQSARSYIFSTALAIPVVAALNQSLKLIQMGDGLRNQLFENISYFNHLAQKLGLNIVSSDLTPIRSVIIGENVKTEHIQEVLIQEGFLVSCIRPPTVPQNSARLRISITALHDRHDIKQLLDALVKVI
jgi:8-amino-7-oxononanoate synthase